MTNVEKKEYGIIKPYEPSQDEIDRDWLGDAAAAVARQARESHATCEETLGRDGRKPFGKRKQKQQ